MGTDERHESSTIAEEIQVLGAISRVSGRLARRLAALAAQRQRQEGKKHDEPNERDDTDHRGSAEDC